MSKSELQTLLSSYASALDQVDHSPLLMWVKPGENAALPWLRWPAPRVLVRALVVRHVSRCVAALKRGGARQVALADDGPTAEGNLRMLEHFERSLPNSVRLVVVAPLALLVTMVVAFVIARYWIQTPSGNLMGSLASAALELDRGKALEAFKDNRVQAASTSERWSS